MGGGLSKDTISALTSQLPNSLVTFHCAMIGLDSAGKTTTLYRLKFNQYMSASPTIGFNCEKIRAKNGTTFTIWDVGGQDKLRPLWRSYTRCTDGIIFVVDSTKPERMEEAKLELQRICRGCQQTSSNQKVVSQSFNNDHKLPLLILANKQDLPAAVEVNKMEAMLGLRELDKFAQWHIQPTCAITGDGLDEGVAVLHEMILRKKRTSSKLGRKDSFLGRSSGVQLRKSSGCVNNNVEGSSNRVSRGFGSSASSASSSGESQLSGQSYQSRPMEKSRRRVKRSQSHHY